MRMIIRAIWEFDADVEEFDPKFIDKAGLAKDLTKRELAHMIEHGKISEDDFEYKVVIE